MEVTEKKLAANRANAQKSTGPTSEKGKQTVAQNAIKHGLYTKTMFLDSPAVKEDPSEYNGLIYSLYSELQPEGMLEEFLVRKVANCLWRSRRAVLAENAAIERQLTRLEDDVDSYHVLKDIFKTKHETPTPAQLNHARAMCVGASSIPSAVIGGNILRYEMRLDRQLTRTLRLLENRQKRRRAMEAEEKKGSHKK